LVWSSCIDAQILAEVVSHRVGVAIVNESVLPQVISHCVIAMDSNTHAATPRNATAPNASNADRPNMIAFPSQTARWISEP
jgi:hypothetical protein